VYRWRRAWKTKREGGFEERKNSNQDREILNAQKATQKQEEKGFLDRVYGVRKRGAKKTLHHPGVGGKGGGRGGKKHEGCQGGKKPIAAHQRAQALPWEDKKFNQVKNSRQNFQGVGKGKNASREKKGTSWKGKNGGEILSNIMPF